jgi:hypothetical protein
MTYRVTKICSMYPLLHNEFIFIKKVLIDKGYPLNFIDSYTRKTLKRYHEKINKFKTFDTCNKLNRDPPKNEIILLDIPYDGNPSGSFSKRLVSLTQFLRPASTATINSSSTACYRFFLFI